MKLRRSSPPPPTPRRRAVGFKRSYYFRCPLEREVDVVFINNRTCARVRRCCPFVAPVIKIFYALLQAASERLPQQQEPHLVGFGISSRVRLDTPSLLPSSRLHLGLDCVFAVGKFLFSMQRYPTVVSEPCLCIDGCTSRTQWFCGR